MLQGETDLCSMLIIWLVEAVDVSPIGSVPSVCPQDNRDASLRPPSTFAVKCDEMGLRPDGGVRHLRRLLEVLDRVLSRRSSNILPEDVCLKYATMTGRRSA